MKPTSIRMLILVAVIAAGLSFAYAEWIDGNGRLPGVAWMAVAVVWLVAAFVGVWALIARRRLNPKPGVDRLPPLVAARTTALALAGSRTGAVVFGWYGGLALRLIQETSVAAGRERLLAAGVACVGGLLLTAVSLWLERICRVPGGPGDGPDADGPGAARGMHA